MNRVSSRLAAHTGTRQLDLLHRADAASDAVDAEIARLWDRLTRALQEPVPYALRRRQVWPILQAIWLAARDALYGSLAGLATQGYQTAGVALTQALPAEALGRVVNGRVGGRGPARGLDVVHGRLLGRQVLGEGHRVLEDTRRDARPGIVRFDLTRGRPGFRDRAATLREPAVRSLTPDQQREQFQQLLFPPPSEQQVQAILRQPIAGRSWIQSLTNASKLAGFDPERMANAIATGFALGKPPREIAQDLLPAVDGVKTSARRIARTYGMQVAHHGAMEAYQQAGDLIAGFQIHAQLDQHTRSAHRARNGTIYWKNPGPGQLGLDQMPHPPLEADGSTAWNCRCWLSPVLSPVPEIETSPVFTTNREQLIPDPAVYSDWFATASLSARKLAVGARRYSMAQEVLGGEREYRTTLADGQPVEFTRHQSAPDTAVLMWIHPRAIAPDLSVSGVPGRKEDFEQFMATGRPIQAPRLTLDKHGQPDFIDGRHRTSVLADRGASRIVISVHPDDVAGFRRLGAQPAAGEPRRPNWETFVNPETGEVLSALELRLESPVARAERVAKVRAMMAQRRADIADVATFGFVPAMR